MPTVMKASTTARYYSVKNAVRIGGNRRVPSVCYPITGSETASVLDMAAKGQAFLYNERMRFVSGKAYPAEVKAAAQTAEASVPVVTESVAVDTAPIEEKKKPKAKKAAETEPSSVSSEEVQVKREFDEVED